MTPDSQNTTDTPRLGAICVGLMRELVEARNERDEARRERDSYRFVAQQSLHALADLTGRHRRQADRYHALLDERRQPRVQGFSSKDLPGKYQLTTGSQTV